MRQQARAGREREMYPVFHCRVRTDEQVREREERREDMFQTVGVVL